jgi:hypothetical protein
MMDSEAANAAASAVDAAALAAAEEAAEAAASGLESHWVGADASSIDQGDGMMSEALLMSKVVAARRSRFRTEGHLDPLYLLEAVQVGREGEEGSRRARGFGGRGGAGRGG